MAKRVSKKTSKASKARESEPSNKDIERNLNSMEISDESESKENEPVEDLPEEENGQSDEEHPLDEMDSDGKTDLRRMSTFSYQGMDLQKQDASIKAVKAPILKLFERKSIVKFMEEKRKYENHCIQYNVQPTSINDMIDAALNVMGNIPYEIVRTTMKPKNISLLKNVWNGKGRKRQILINDVNPFQ